MSDQHELGASGQEAFDLISRYRVVAIIRGLNVSHAVAAARALAEGGIRALEVTFAGPGPEEVAITAATIAEMRGVLPDGLAVGAGTVLTHGQLRAATGAGAQFIVSPDTNPGVISATREAGLVSLPGAMTPSECMAAWRAGANFVKLFPAGPLGLEYFKAIRSPLPWLPLVVVGGIDADNAAGFLVAGAAGLGVGGRLVNKSWIAAGEFGKITDTAAQLMRVVRESTQ